MIHSTVLWHCVCLPLYIQSYIVHLDDVYQNNVFTLRTTVFISGISSYCLDFMKMSYNVATYYNVSVSSILEYLEFENARTSY